MGESDALLVAEGLVKHFPAWKKELFGKRPPVVHAVDDVSFEIRRGETFGLVGESGCGKSTTAQCVVRLLEPTRGRLIFDGKDVTTAKERRLRAFRRRVQLVMQDPVTALDPRAPAYRSLTEPLRVHRIGDRRSRDRRADELLERVGLHPADAKRYPHELSGGQCQRIAIARALILDPDLLVLDEAVSALDVSVQADILNLLADLQKDLNLTYLFIAHDLAVVRQVCDRVAVMYLGQIVEQCDRHELFTRPLHPYTQSLMAAIPIPDPFVERSPTMLASGDVPSPVHPPSGCRFHTRCPIGSDKEVCHREEPRLSEGEPWHPCACHFPAVRGQTLESTAN